MIAIDSFLDGLERHAFDFHSGVPCSLLKPYIRALETKSDSSYVPATNEGDAVAIACGAQLAGKMPVVFCQNSGLGNAVNPLTSLAWPFRIPFLLVTTWRGDPNGEPDEPQHELMGAMTPSLLESMQIPYAVLPERARELDSVLDTARTHLREHGRPFGLIVPKGRLGGESTPTARPELVPSAPLRTDAREAVDVLDPDAVLRVVSASTANDAVLTTTGFTGRALYAVQDRPNQLYMVGSMGCVSSLGLGHALARPNRRVVVLDGDGAFQMRMGALAALGHERPTNLVHVLLDNSVHDSTGAQPTLSGVVDAVGVASACGYPRTLSVSSLDALERALDRPPSELTFLYVRTAPRADRALPRPSILPHEVAERFRAWSGSA